MREMKDSRIPWIGKIPQNWKTPSLKYITDDITDFTASGSFADLAQNVKYLDSEDYAMLIRAADLSAKRKISHIYINKHAYDYLKKSNLHGGELILPNIGSVGTIYRYTPLYKRSTLAPNSIMIKSINNHFMYYLFDNGAGENALKGLSNATTQSKFNKTQLRNLKVILPSKGEQKTITDFLDSKCADIDSLTEDIQKQIDTLKEYKKSVITQAVTKGLDPNVEMKDSGITWIGKMPKYWKLPKISYYSTSRSGGTPDRHVKEYWEAGTLPWMASGEVNKEHIYETNEKITLIGSLNSSAKPLNPPCVMVALNGQGKTKGMSAILHIKAACNQSLCAFNCDENILDYRYLYFCFKSMYRFLRSQAGDNLRDGLSATFVKNQIIPLPLIKEQQTIADYLDSKCVDIDAAIEGKQKQLEVLKEYKKSLIYEYVTGKKEVPCHE